MSAFSYQALRLRPEVEHTGEKNILLLTCDDEVSRLRAPAIAGLANRIKQCIEDLFVAGRFICLLQFRAGEHRVVVSNRTGVVAFKRLLGGSERACPVARSRQLLLRHCNIAFWRKSGRIADQELGLDQKLAAGTYGFA